MPSPSSKIAFSIGGFDIMWYGILVAVAIALCVFLPMVRAKSHGMDSDRVLNYGIVVVVAGIIGARLYYVAFNWDYYGEDLARIFATREGGLAIHGGLLFGALGAIILARRYRENVLNLFDLAFTSVPLGQAVGRWGNYFNQEAHGGPTDLPWGLMIDGEKVHPTFLYESIWCFLLFLFLLLVIEPRRRFVGQTFLLYTFLYSAERFFVEGLRTDSLMLGPLRQAQVLSVVAAILAVIGYAILYRRAKRSGRAAALDTQPADGSAALDARPADESAAMPTAD
ncbi:MAG: prolipoprotein diacylglyceryl transferase, partial [Clostridiales Family XIII bacterium]|nr:prolipoprotein diacylglyceryl transferase [Clostridiales Family XIII bacterium]